MKLYGIRNNKTGVLLSVSYESIAEDDKFCGSYICKIRR